MDRWQTTVSGSTYADIANAAKTELQRFFGDAHTKYLARMEYDIRTRSVTRDGHGFICSATYEADITVVL